MSNTSGNPRSTSEYQAFDRRHHWHPFTDTKALNKKGTRVIVRADGVYLWDTDGNRILDGMAGLWCVNIGYGRKELCDAAYAQMLELPYYNSFFQTAHPPAIELSKILAEVTPAGLQYAFFTNSGSEANDTVVRLVRHYWSVRGQPSRDIIISRDNAYHGSTVAAASLGGMQPMHAQGGLPIPGVEHIMQPHYYLLGEGMDEKEFGLLAARALEEKIHALGKHRVAAFIAEPIQGAGGVIVPPSSYWPEIQRICREYEILLVADEVICGFGRTGEWFGTDYYGLQADLMPIAKGLSSGYLPIGAVMIGDKVAETVIESGGEFAHGYTYSGHPASCAVAIENIRILQRERIIEKAAQDVAPYFQKCLAEFSNHPLVGEVRGVGMFAGIELSADKRTRARFKPLGKAGTLCRDLCIENGLVMRAVGDRMILSPPLVITREQIDELIGKVAQSFDMTAKELGIQ
ncbi:MAG: aspartate aminotransferase family protein [Gammaproteobacteria bacterium]|nr:aspartate aminotransferase family protein [Gammaproteobacteria bacterium]